MKTLAEYNKDKHELYRKQEEKPDWLGIACDDCGKELFDPTSGVRLLSYPAKIHTKCSGCGKTGYAVA